MTTHVLTQEELVQVQGLQSKRDKLTIEFGYTEFQIQELELQKESLIEQLSQLKSQEIQIGTKLQEKYGEGSIDIAKGEFINSN
jgi:uncharacterized coiled-coil DUF342 family protein